jgi:hypothetical protein
MNFHAAAAAGLALAGGVATWSWLAAQPAAVHSSDRVAVHRAAAVAQAPDGSRLFLSNAQVKQAMASGTIDRPVKSLLRISKPMEFGDFVWSDHAVANGPVWIRVDLRSQLISVFRAGHEIGTAVIVYGGDNKQTPTGTLHILGKDADHRSSLYDAAMPYTLRLTNDGVSIHGSKVRWGAATHGCIGVPIAFARHLFEVARIGDEVSVVPNSARHSPPA